MDNTFFVYRHIRLDKNEPFYIGIGKKSKNFNNHRTEFSRAYDTNSRNRFWKHIVSKTDFRVEIIFESDSHEEVKEKEVEFINLYGRRDLKNGTLSNMTNGGDGVKNRIFREESKQKLSEAKKGIPRPREVIEKMREANLGSKKSDEFRKKCADRRLGTKLAAETIQKLRDSKLGKPNKGTSKHFRNIGKYVLDSQTGVYYNSISDACEATNCSYDTEYYRLHKNTKLARFIRAYDEQSK
jgi:hypothetical protein